MSREYLLVCDGSMARGNHCLFSEEMIIGRERYLGWPVDAYRIFVPTIKDDHLGDRFNPFERIVLAQLAVEDPLVNSDKALAERVCLPQDFVHDIVLKLEGRGLVTPSTYRLEDKVVARMRDAIEGDQSSELIEMLTGFVFREAATGRMLPHVLFAEEQNGGMLETMDYDEVAKRRPIVLEANDAVVRKPTIEEVKAVLTSWRRRVRDGGRRIPSYAKFEVLDAPESYYLLCPLAVRRCDGEDRIGDPFGIGYSLVLEAAFEEAMDDNAWLCEKIEGWKKELENQDEQIRERLDQIKFPFAVEALEANYPRLAGALKTAYGSTSSSIPDLFSALEWGFHYHLADEAESIRLELASMTNDEFENRARKTLTSLGWEKSRLPTHRPQDGQVNAFSTGSSALFKTLFPIMLIRQTERPVLARIHDDIPDFPGIIAALRELRGAKSHGGTVDYGMRMSYADTRSFIERLLTILLPDVAFSESTPEPVLMDAETDHRFKARNEVRRGYGRTLYKRLPRMAQEHLVEAQIEFDTLASDGNAVKLVREAAAAMQALLSDVLKDLPRKRDRRPFETARDRLKAFGFDSLSDAFKDLNPERVRRGLSGSEETLGVAGLVLALCGDDLVLTQIAMRDRRFFNFIGDVHDCRGHDNQVVLSDEERKNLQIRLKRFIETLMEVCYGQEE